MDNPNSGPAWYALQVRTQLSKTAATGLSEKGYEVFLPTCLQSRQWSDRLKQSERLLFPGYLFCRFNASDRLLPILMTVGVLSIVCAGKSPVSVPDEEVLALQRVTRSGLRATPWPRVAAGTRILIEKGPLAGVEGIAVDGGKGYRLIVSVELLQRAVMVELDRDWVRRIENPPARRGLGLEYGISRAMTA